MKKILKRNPRKPLCDKKWETVFGEVKFKIYLFESNKKKKS